MTMQPATEKQMAFIAELCHSIDPDNAAEDILAIQDGPLSKRDASKVIDSLIAQRRQVQQGARPEQAAPAPAAPAVELGEGFYRNDSGIYRVAQAKQGSHLLAKRLDPQTGKFQYVGAAKRFVKADQRLTLEEAQEYGKRTGRCLVCGRELTNEVSVAEGVGPVCARRF